LAKCPSEFVNGSVWSPVLAESEFDIDKEDDIDGKENDDAEDEG
jgi:hypothetical protein